MVSPTCAAAAASDAAQLKSAKEDIKVLLRTKFCHPILVKSPSDYDPDKKLFSLLCVLFEQDVHIFQLQVRLGWHDAGTYNKNIEDWPQRGGANGSLRFEPELKHAANAGNLLLFTLNSDFFLFL